MKKSLLALTLAAAFSGMQAESRLYIESVPSAKQGVIELKLKLDADADAVAGYQAKLTSESNAAVVENSPVMNSENKIPGENSFFGTHNVGNDELELNILSYSDKCQTFSAGSGQVIATIPVTINEAGTYNFTLTGIILADATGDTTPCSDVPFTVTVNAGVQYDVNGDGTFNFADVLDLFDYYNEDETNKLIDFNGDGSKNFADILDLIDYYNEL